MAANDKKTQSLSIFLIKEEYKSVEEIVLASGCSSPIVIPITELGDAQLYIKRNPTRFPKTNCGTSLADLSNVRSWPKDDTPICSGLIWCNPEQFIVA
ncbi:hypothetical protein [Marinomonas aquiplantarum]|uniref:hypothetical protein n=1 Tax=Marinomonas aquiplantarum TaxID=491951 RepID=UPI000DEB787C|nr:hypothetical protein [Marinomonas aquiplantarum]